MAGNRVFNSARVNLLSFMGCVDVVSFGKNDVLMKNTPLKINPMRYFVKIVRQMTLDYQTHLLSILR